MSNYRIKDIPINERPRERLNSVGKENLTDKELISIILKNGFKDKNVEDIAIELLNIYSLNELKDIEIEDLIKIKGIGIAKATELVASIELGKRIYLKEELKGKLLSSPKEIWKDAKYILNGKKQEHFYCYYFNNKQQLIKRKLVYIGTINSSITHTREIFKEAYKLSASSIVCIHNHPSDDTTPSKADLEFTKRLIQTGNIQGIPVLDHIIVGDTNYYSFYEHNNINSV